MLSAYVSKFGDAKCNCWAIKSNMWPLNEQTNKQIWPGLEVEKTNAYSDKGWYFSTSMSSWNFSWVEHATTQLSWNTARLSGAWNMFNNVWARIWHNRKSQINQCHQEEELTEHRQANVYAIMIGLDNHELQHKIGNIFLSTSFHICFGCSKEPSHWDGSSKYPQLMFGNKKINFSSHTLIYTTLTTLSAEYLVMRRVYTDVGGIK